MIPILFEHDAVSFEGHGLGDLIDCISCESAVTDEGEYELQFEYPIGSELFPELKLNRIVLAKVNDFQNPQAFRIYSYEKEIKGIVKVNCQHLSYDLSRIPTKDFKDITTCASALSTMKSRAIVACPFNFITDIPDYEKPQIEDNKFKIEVPESIRACHLDGDDSIKGCWGGDLVFDNYNVSLLKQAGEDRGVIIEYGIDLMDMDQEENISEMVTAILPYFRYHVSHEDSTESEDLVFYGDTQYVEGTFEQQNIRSVDLTEHFPNQENGTHPSTAELNAKAREWMEKEEDVGRPKINLKISYAQLGQDVRLHDAVTVRFIRMGIDVKSKVTSYKYDVLKERCSEIEIGKTRASDVFSLEDASRLRKGLIPPKRIQNNSITNNKLSAGSIGGRSVAAGGIQGWHLRDLAINEDKIAPDAVTVNKIRDGAVVSAKIDSLAVTGDKLATGSVNGDKILNNAITYAKMWNAAAGSEGSFQVFWSDLIATLAMFSDTAEFSRYIKTSRIYTDGLFVKNKYGALQNITYHTHRFREGANGTIIMDNIEGANVDLTGAPHSFNIADTKKYKDDVSAATVASITYQTTGANTYGSFDQGFDLDIPFDRLYSTNNKLYGRIRVLNEDNGLIKLMRVSMPDRFSEAQVTAMNFYTLDGEETVSYNSSNITLSASVQATLSNGNASGSVRTVTIPANLAYNAVTISSTELNGSATYQSAYIRYAVPIKATASNGNYSTNTLYVNASDAYNAGINTGAGSATPISPDVSAASTPIWDEDDRVYYSTVTVLTRAEATFTSGVAEVAPRYYTTQCDTSAAYYAGRNSVNDRYQEGIQDARNTCSAGYYSTYSDSAGTYYWIFVNCAGVEATGFGVKALKNGTLISV